MICYQSFVAMGTGPDGRLSASVRLGINTLIANILVWFNILWSLNKYSTSMGLES